MQALARNGYTSSQVYDTLRGRYGRREARFRYDLLNSSDVKIGELSAITGGRVSNNALAEIKRTAVFELTESQETLAINYLSDRIMPWCELKMTDGGWAKFPLGVFLLSTPKRQAGRAGEVARSIEAYDKLQILVDDKFADRYRVAAGTNYISAVSTILTGAGIGITKQNLTPTASTLPTDREWEPGMKKLQAVNDLLEACNYRSLRFDESGYAVAIPYQTPDQRPVEDVYKDDDEGIIVPAVAETVDLFAIPNKWVLVVSQPDRAVLTSTYTNSNAASPTSTVSRGRTIVDFRQVDAADQTALDGLAQRLASEASQVYSTVEWESWIMPHHSDFDVYELHYTALALAHKYAEIAWDFDLTAGARMCHRCRRVVAI